MCGGYCLHSDYPSSNKIKTVTRIKHCLTIPEEPDWYGIYELYRYNVYLRVLFDDNNVWEQTANLKEYYDWANNNRVNMHHTIMRTPNANNMGGLSFMFDDETHAMAFKLKYCYC